MRRLKSNASLTAAYRRAVDVLSKSGEPASCGKRLHGEYAAYYEYRLSGSYRRVYRVDRAAHRIILFKVGDHKELFGRDDR